jgi:prolyl 4-hydroxylase
MTDCVPEAGMVLLFEHRLMHEGSLLEAGVKYAIRTDVMATKP